MNIRFCVLCLIISALCFGCAIQELPSPKSAVFATLEEFRRGPKGGVDLVWSTPTIRDTETLKSVLKEYDSLMLDQTWVVIDKDTSSILDDRQILELSRMMVKEIRARLGHGYTFVEIAGDSTLRLNIALTNLVMVQPVLAVARGLVTAGSATSTVTTIVADAQTRTGGVTVELLVSDAQTNEALLAAIDRNFSDQDFGPMLASTDGVQKAITLWADRLWTTLSYWNWINR